MEEVLIAGASAAAGLLTALGAAWVALSQGWVGLARVELERQQAIEDRADRLYAAVSADLEKMRERLDAEIARGEECEHARRELERRVDDLTHEVERLRALIAPTEVGSDLLPTEH